MGKNQHVTPHERGWAVTADGAEAPSAIFKTQSEAWEKAKSLARKERSEALLHGKNGRIRERNTYGHDPRRSTG
ncbi:MAG: DUF2188 domain-containing protein [Methyloceanibacter sp.]